MKQKRSCSLIAILTIPLLLVAVLNVSVSFLWQQHQQSQDGLPRVTVPLSSSVVTTTTNLAATGSMMYRQLPLSTLAQSSAQNNPICPQGLQFRSDRPKTTNEVDFSNHQSGNRKIPRIVHQTSKSRCLANNVFALTDQWQFDGWEYYLHDDEAIERLFVQEAVHFPLLPLISRHCLMHGTLKADLWRYLVLWVYGGIYTDLDTAPQALVPETTIGPDDDALFVVEQFHLLSQYFMAVSPRHPLVWYAIQRALQNLWDLPDTGRVSAAMTTGPHALHLAYRDFRADAGQFVDPAEPGYKPVWAGRFVGSLNYTVTVVGVGENQNEYVHRDLLGAQKKQAAYKQMHMRHFQQDKKFPTGRSCLSTILDGSYKAPN
eukprot:scaffold2353_cov167-Amphora_coffeaeformis.AAC.71